MFCFEGLLCFRLHPESALMREEAYSSCCVRPQCTIDNTTTWSRLQGRAELSLPAWHFPGSLKIITLPRLTCVLIRNTWQAKDTRRSVHGNQFSIRWEINRRLLNTRGLILSALFRDGIKKPKGNMLSLLTGNKPWTEYYSLHEGDDTLPLRAARGDYKVCWGPGQKLPGGHITQHSSPSCYK